MKNTVRELNKLGYKTKSWISEKGKTYIGGVFTKRPVRYILENPIYAGKIVHKGKVYDGKHQPIIDPEAWQKTQEIFASPLKVNKSISRVSIPPLLKGIIFCGCCNTAMTPTYSVKKNGNKYRYYVCSSRNRLANENCTIGNISAPEVEKSVKEQVLRLISRPEIVARVIALAKESNNQEEALGDIKIIEALRDAAKIWDELFPVEQIRLTHLLIKQVKISESKLEISIFTEGLNDLGNELTIGAAA